MVELPNLNCLWAKSDAGGRPHSLPGHLLDTAAVAELIWDRFMAPTTKQSIDVCAGGRGRDLFRLLCGLHDIGKATPAFQVKVRGLAEITQQAGFPLTRLSANLGDAGWHHRHAGRAILDDTLRARGIDAGWFAVLVEGHHGKFTSRGFSRLGHGSPAWAPHQQRLVSWVEGAIGVSIDEVELTAPSRAHQLALAGFLVMADWVASCDLFTGLGTDEVSLDAARQRASQAWGVLGFPTFWTPSSGLDANSLFKRRFGVEARPFQRDLVGALASVDEPGLVVVEAPMGEGKTEAALIVAEVLAGRFGCNGIVFGMPTQGTSDAMYHRCRGWAESIDSGFALSLVHGKAMLNEEYQRAVPPQIGDIYGDEDDPYLSDDLPAASMTERSWLQGRHRALLAPSVVCTVDQLLYAGTRTKFVMLRHAGLAGKVVIVDEVHSYDVYMASFLHELLRWLGQAKVPVILMSATLPPSQLLELEEAYAGVGLVPRDAPDGYPRATFSSVGCATTRSIAASSWRPDLPVSVEVLGDLDGGVEAVAARICSDLSDGGCGLAIMNTVRRSQGLARRLRELGVSVELIHGRLTTAERADRTARAIDMLGPGRTRSNGRPAAHVIVATQIAEQSFDVDADVLYTDLAPVDLLLQRVGRLHRHSRPAADRPKALRAPKVVVTGFEARTDGCRYPPAFDHVYDPWTMIRSAWVVSEANVWSMPSDVPNLVAGAYGAISVTRWAAAEADALAESRRLARDRKAVAGTYVLGSGTDPAATDLVGLHQAGTDGGDEYVVVRDGEPTLEVCLVIRDADGYRSLGGRPLGPTGERCTDRSIAREVLGDTIRVRDTPAFRNQPALPGWEGSPLLSRQPVIELSPELRAEVDGLAVEYDREYGLTIGRGR